jgi:tRNA pseudouridine38-40 synthase
MKVILRGNGFMTYMVRILVGVAFKVAIGKLSLDEVKQMLDPSERKIISYKAPAEGLCLEEVIYGNAL